MAGIYIHIPFCKQACYYCNFHFSTRLAGKGAMVNAICKDIHLRHKYLKEQSLQSVYFGGGTPSLLDLEEISSILDSIRQHFEILPDAEITLESNPDDIKAAYLRGLKQLGVNRISLGIQSFFDADLQFMHRAHNGAEAFNSLEIIREEGFHNITADLIYGSATTTDDMWEMNVQKIIESGIPHLSAYCLTIEENTVFGRWHKHKKIQAIDDVKASRQFYQMLDLIEKAGYVQYEISNFAKPGFEAVHNKNYWMGASYLGLGPAAHSFNGAERCWTVSNNARYVESVAEGKVELETETLTTTDLINEMIMTKLRISSGLDLEEVKSRFGNNTADTIESALRQDWICQNIEREGSIVRLNRSGKMMADRVAAALFIA